MIDIHTHVLAAVDDGSNDFAQSLEMLVQSEKIGITDVVLTPHFRGAYAVESQKLLECFNKFKQEVARAGLSTNLYLGQEIFCTNSIKKLLKEGRVLCMNNTKYILVEFDYAYKQDIPEMVYELCREGYIPIVAHFERYSYADFNMAIEIKQSGGLIQLNAQSVLGKSGLRLSRLAKKLLKKGLVDFIASDIHSARTNYMKEAYEKVSKKFGKEMAQAIFNENAKDIIKG